MIVKPARLSRVAEAAYWTLPSLFCLWLYWYGLLAWFTQDDFAWLGLKLHVHSMDELWQAMFTPMAQGSIRPWSERGFFLLFSWLFGLDALPYRIFVFLTQFANLVLLASITRKLTGSPAAGFLAPVLWTANSVLGVAMSWSSSYNQILCAFFLFAAFRLFLRYVTTGRLRDYIFQFAVFLLGFGALEINVVYPGLAACYALGCARKYLVHTVPMFAVSTVYAILHRSLSPADNTGVYTMYYDASVFSTLGTYVLWALGPIRFTRAHPQWEWAVPYASGVIALAILGFAAWQLLRGADRCRRWLPVFFLGWFFIVLGPVLPLKDHLSDYYLTIPTAGLAALAAWGLVVAWKSGWAWRAASIGVAGIYLAFSIPAAHRTAAITYQFSESVRSLVFGVERARQLHPGKIILLADVENYLFWKGIVDEPFRLLGIEDVYIAPGTESRIEPHPELGGVQEFVFPPGVVAQAIDQKKAVVYSAAGPILRNTTREYRNIIAARLPAGLSKRLEVGNAVFDEQLGPGWYQDEGRFRWMSKRAVVFLGGPDSSYEKLQISGRCDIGQLQKGPLGVEVRVNGQLLGRANLEPGEPDFDFAWPLPATLAGIRQMKVEIEVERTITPPGDGRELGLAFGSFSVKP